MTRTALYRHYDANGDLLYVGVTDVLGRRDKEHTLGSVWHRLVFRSDVYWYDTRAEALAAERNAIQVELPLYNVRIDPVEVVAPPQDGWRKVLYDEVQQSDHSMRYLSISAGLGAGYLHSILMNGKEPSLSNFLSICIELGVDPSTIIARAIE